MVDRYIGCVYLPCFLWGVHKLSIFCFLSWVDALGCLICGGALF